MNSNFVKIINFCTHNYNKHWSLITQKIKQASSVSYLFLFKCILNFTFQLQKIHIYIDKSSLLFLGPICNSLR